MNGMHVNPKFISFLFINMKINEKQNLISHEQMYIEGKTLKDENERLRSGSEIGANIKRGLENELVEERKHNKELQEQIKGLEFQIKQQKESITFYQNKCDTLLEAIKVLGGR